MRAVLLVALVVVLVACGAYSFPGAASPSATTGSVSGHVVAVPCAPVEQPQNPCAGRPVGGLELDFVSEQQTTVFKTATDSRGNYAMTLPPGTYNVRPQTYMQVVSGPAKIVVTAGSSLTADYVLDSGIRAPVPQQ